MIDLDSARTARELAQKLDSAFSWSDTPQGHGYWSTVQDNLNNLASAAEAAHSRAANIRLEVGKKYKLNDGSIVTIIQNDKHPKWPFNGDNGRSYSINGTPMRVDGSPIVEEIKTGIQLKVGGKYKTKGGQVVEIEKTTGDSTYPFLTKCDCSYTVDGFYWSDKHDNNLNIVEVVDEPSELKMQAELGGKKYKLVEVA